jgi:hypothetical protein
MRFFLKLFATLLAIAVVATALGYLLWNKTKPSFLNKEQYTADKTTTENNLIECAKLKEKSSSLKNYIVKNKFDPRYCFMVDMHLSSGKKRFFVYNLQKDSVEKAGLVAHGSGSDKGDSLVFSNLPESNCTSLGKYRIGKPYKGRFGISYKLYGLDKTNSNAYKRFVVLHPYWQVPANEVAPSEICRSLGCPMVSPIFMEQLKPYIDDNKKPVLLYIFY